MYDSSVLSITIPKKHHTSRCPPPQIDGKTFSPVACGSFLSLPAVGLFRGVVQAFSSDMADTVEGIKLLVRPRLILVDLNMANNQPLFEMVVAPLIEGGDPIDFR